MRDCREILVTDSLESLKGRSPLLGKSRVSFLCPCGLWASLRHHVLLAPRRRRHLQRFSGGSSVQGMDKLTAKTLSCWLDRAARVLYSSLSPETRETWPCRSIADFVQALGLCRSLRHPVLLGSPWPTYTQRQVQPCGGALFDFTRRVLALSTESDMTRDHATVPLLTGTGGTLVTG